MQDPELPFIPALCCFFLPPGKVWRGSARDLKDFYYQLAVPQARFADQQLGPRVPRSWFQDIAVEQLDCGVPFERLAWRDVHASPGQPVEQVADSFTQPALKAVMMGDINGVTMAQAAHVGGLQARGLLPAALRLHRDGVRWGRSDMADVYLDDFAVLAAVDAKERCDPGWDSSLIAAVDNFYEEEGVQQSHAKSVNSERCAFKLWGAVVDG